MDMNESSNVLNDIQNASESLYVSESPIEIGMDESTTNSFGNTPIQSTESIKIEVLPIASISTMDMSPIASSSTMDMSPIASSFTIDISPIKRRKQENVPPQTPTFQRFDIPSTSGLVSQNFRYNAGDIT